MILELTQNLYTSNETKTENYQPFESSENIEEQSQNKLNDNHQQFSQQIPDINKSHHLFPKVLELWSGEAIGSVLKTDTYSIIDFSSNIKRVDVVIAYCRADLTWIYEHVLNS